LSLQGTINDARELLAILKECEIGLSGQRVKDKTKNAQSLTISVWELYITMRRLKVVMGDMGLPKEVEATMALMTRMLLILNSIRNIMLVIEAIEAAKTPLGLGLFKLAVGIAYTSILASDLDRVAR
jgi:hypothetical protein